MTFQTTIRKTVNRGARRATLLLVAGIALMLSSAVATAKIRVGTAAAETLVGTLTRAIT